MTSTISEIESAYLATKQGERNPGLAPDNVDVPGLRRVVIATGQVMVNGEPADAYQRAEILDALKKRAVK